MSTPELPPPNAYFWTPKPGSGLPPELKSWSTNPGPRPEWDIVGYYTTEEVAAAVLAEQEKAEAMRTKAQELVDALDGSYWSSWQTTAGFSAQWEALRAAIRAEPKERQP